MRPIKLTMTAFGPYKQKEIIDFAELGAHRLFAISGQTGAGKTTIFDGISFALFGSGSGEDRKDTKTMRSDFADDQDYTAVALVFELRGKTYRVLRQLGHVKKGNKTATGERYEFFEIHADGTETPAVDRQKVSDINKRLEELLGLTQQQFKQIVMLPQGEFRKLLTSDSKEKEEILRKIFKTEPYDQLVKQLDLKRLELTKQTAHAKTMYSAKIQQLQGALPQRESALFDVLAQQHHNIHQLVDALQQETDFYQQQLPTLHKQVSEQQQQESKLNQQLGQAQQFNEQLTKYRTMQQQLERLLQQQAQMQLLKDELHMAEQAAQMQPYAQQYEDIKQEHQQSIVALEQARQTKQQQEQQLVTVKQRYEELNNQQQMRDAMRVELDRLEQLLPLFTTRTQKEQQLQQVTQQEQQAAAAYNDHVARLEKFQQLLTQTEQQYRHEQQLGAQLSEQQQQLQQLERQWQAYEEFTAQQQAVKQQFAQLSEQQQHYTQADDTYRQQYERWLQHEAAQLADLLEHGKPCAVCGSTEHPQPATRAANVQTKEQIAQLQQRAQQAQQQYHAANAGYEQAVQLQQHYEERCNSLDIQMATASSLQQLVAEHRALVAQTAAHQDTSVKLLQKLDNGKIKFAQEQHNEKEQVMALQQLQTDKRVAEQALADIIARLPSHIENAAMLQQQLELKQQNYHTLMQEWQRMEQSYEQADRQYEFAVQQITATELQLENMTAKLAQAQQAWQQAFNAATFVDEQAFLKARRSREYCEHNRQQLTQYEDELRSVQAIVENGERQFNDQQFINVEQLQQQLQHTHEQVQQVQRLAQQIEAYYQTCENMQQDLTRTSGQVEQLLQQENELTTLYDLLRGKNSKKVSFERYVQIGFLEQITEAANIRLRYLSNGQFTLQCSDRLEGGGRQSGLSLDVYDAYTGLMRDVKTLSGGEKFNASLALALGMADVIQSFQGNIQIETMFIDEGFGSLDDETLTKAVDTLVDLQKSGRMIGIISHVNELKAAMPAVLQVTKSKEGYSTTQFILK